MSSISKKADLNNDLKTDIQAQINESPQLMLTRWLDVTTVEQTERSVKHLSGETRGHSPESLNDRSSLITFRASIESEDRAGDVIRAEGWDLENYRRNPVVLWAHRHDLLPIGKTIDIWVESGALFATVEFARTEFARQIQKLFEGGFLRGVSVGFRALKTSARSGMKNRGTIFEKQELLEISAAPVPMHPDALATRAHAGQIATSQISDGQKNDKTTSDSEQRELLPLFRQLTEIWQSIAAISN